MRISDKTFRRIVLAGMSFGFALVLIATVGVGVVMARGQAYSAWVNHTYEVARTLADLGQVTERVETQRRGYIITGDSKFRQRYIETARQIPPLTARIGGLTRDNPAQRGNTARLETMLVEQRAGIAQTLSEIAAGRRGAIIARFNDDRALQAIRAIRRQLTAMTAEEERLPGDRRAEQALAVRRLYWLLGILLVLLAASALASLWVILSYGRNLNRSADELRQLNEGLEGAVAARTVDLKRANDEIQRFAYIVSHDLRSPLVNVMGFTAELETAAKTLDGFVGTVEETAPQVDAKEAALAAREDLPEAIGFIRSSTEKMDRLINAILRLSREGRRSLAAHPIDMDQLIAGIRDSLQHRLSELDGDVRIAAPLPTLVNDRLAVEQVFSNLIENAVKYRSPKRPPLIEVRGHSAGPRIVYEVVDNGRGIAPRDHDRVFDLFRRSGPQDQPGEGIGLAHVRALVYRLGGTITCESQLDAGATFRLSLPAILAPGEAAA